MTVKGLREQTIAQGLLHESVAKELQTNVTEPFEKWAASHRERLLTSKANLLEGWVYSYEQGQTEVRPCTHELTRTHAQAT